MVEHRHTTQTGAKGIVDMKIIGFLVAVQFALISVLLYWVNTVDRDVSFGELRMDTLTASIGHLGGQVTNLKTQVGDTLGQDISDLRYLAAFGYSSVPGSSGVGCNGAEVTEGTLGAAAFRALKKTQLCDPKIKSAK